MILAWIILALAALPFGITLANLRLLSRPEPADSHSKISLLIPARNEAANIAVALQAALASTHPDFEVIVLDDGSTDDTAALVGGFAVADTRVRLETGVPLPPGWSGKMHACARLAQLASGDLLVFVDADVALAPKALAALDGFMAARPAVGYASGVPRQIAVTLAEKLIVPLIDFLLLGYLPIARMRRLTDPSLGAGCGQLVVVRADLYRQVGGHAAIGRTLHDGLMLPRLFRSHGIATDLFDASRLATCRMYHGFGEVWHGFGKNAREGLATPRALPIWTVLLGGGQVLPYFFPWLHAGFPLAAAAALSLATRLAITLRFRGSLLGAVLHPVGIALLLAIQWTAFLRAARKRPSFWRGREYS